MATILLVHGSWHGGWVWGGIRSALAALGNVVHAPCLHGLGEDAANLHQEIGLWIHIDDLEALIVERTMGDVILVGHSYEGTVVHGLEGRITSRLSAVIHLEGTIPEPGSSIMDSWREDYRLEIMALADAHHGWLVPPPDPGIWTGLDEDQRKWIRPKLWPQSLRTFQDVMPDDLTSFTGPHIYLWARDRPTQPYRAVVERFLHEPNWTISKTKGGHELPLTNPKAVEGRLQLIVDGSLAFARMAKEELSPLARLDHWPVDQVSSRSRRSAARQ